MDRANHLKNLVADLRQKHGMEYLRVNFSEQIEIDNGDVERCFFELSAADETDSMLIKVDEYGMAIEMLIEFASRKPFNFDKPFYEMIIEDILDYPDENFFEYIEGGIEKGYVIQIYRESRISPWQSWAGTGDYRTRSNWDIDAFTELLEKRREEREETYLARIETEEMLRRTA